MKTAPGLSTSSINLQAPVSSIMTPHVISVEPQDPLIKIKEIFDKHRIHHIPVVNEKILLGMISKSDFLHFIRGMHQSSYDKMVETVRLERYRAEDIMTKGVATLEANDRINVAIEIFKENLFHAIPVVKDGGLVGIVTTLDIIKMLSDEDDQRIAALRT